MYFTLYFQGTWGSLTLKNRQFQPRSLNVGTLHASHVLHAKHCFAWNGAVDIAESWVHGAREQAASDAVEMSEASSPPTLALVEYE